MSKNIGWIGTKQWTTTSIPNTEIIPPVPQEYNWTQGYEIKKLDFWNPEQECTVLINNKYELLIPIGAGFTSSVEDPVISSFIILEPNIKYTFMGVY